MREVSSESQIRREVDSYLHSQRRDDYEQLLDIVERYLNWLRDRPNLFDVIYRVYSRKDKQRGGSSFKETWKIAQKIAKWRRDDPTRRSRPEDVHDIVGATVVAYYDTQIPHLSKLFEAHLSRFRLRIVGKVRQHNEDTYKALHYTVESASPVLSRLKAEVQIKSLLYDGWGAKTHDLIYKPKDGSVPGDLRTQANLLAQSVGLLEKQSDILRKVIDELWQKDSRRRRAARMSFYFDMSNRTGVDEAYSQFMSDVRADADALAVCDFEHQTFVKHLERWNQHHDEKGPSEDACRALSFLASTRATGDLNERCLSTIEEWVDGCEDGKDKGRAMLFKALAMHLLGETQLAVDYGRDALDYCKKLRVLENGARMNLAYFIADYYFIRRHHIKDTDEKLAVALRDEANQLIEQVDRVRAIDGTSDDLDTQGLVKIVFGVTPEEIRDGLSLCRKSRNNVIAAAESGDLVAKAREPVVTAFFELHERRASERLLELE